MLLNKYIYIYIYIFNNNALKKNDINKYVCLLLIYNPNLISTLLILNIVLIFLDQSFWIMINYIYIISNLKKERKEYF